MTAGKKSCHSVSRQQCIPNLLRQLRRWKCLGKTAPLQLKAFHENSLDIISCGKQTFLKWDQLESQPAAWPSGPLASRDERSVQRLVGRSNLTSAPVDVRAADARSHPRGSKRAGWGFFFFFIQANHSSAMRALTSRISSPSCPISANLISILLIIMISALAPFS